MKKTMKKLFAFGMAGMMAAGLAGCSGSTQETTVAASVTEAQADTQAGESAASQTDGAYAVTAPVEITFATQDVGTTAYVYEMCIRDRWFPAPWASEADLR